MRQSLILKGLINEILKGDDEIKIRNVIKSNISEIRIYQRIFEIPSAPSYLEKEK